MRQEAIVYEADGLRMHGQLFFESATKARSGVLVFPDVFGLGEHSIERAKRLAAKGYVALACDVHGAGGTVDTLAQGLAILDTLMAAPDRTRARAAGALHALAARPEVDVNAVAAIGFCFGGTMALELARSGAEIKSTVGFHCDLSTTAPQTDSRNIKGRVLVCIGADDPWIPIEQRQTFETEMRDAKVDWQMQLYGNTVHNFTNHRSAAMNMPEAVRYSPVADAHSWSLLEDLLLSTLSL